MEVLSVSDKALISRVERLLAAELALARGERFMRLLYEEDKVHRRDLARRLTPFYEACSRRQKDALAYVESISGIRLDENITLDQALIFVEVLRQHAQGTDDGDIPL